MTSRSSWQGAWQIARFNWPFYAVGVVTTIFLIIAAWLVPLLWMKWACAVMAAGSFYLLVGSLLASHLVYDRSDLYRFVWLERLLKDVPHGRMIVCHSGFDEVSQPLAEKFPATQWRVLDHYDERIMTEPSIRRVRKIFPTPPGTIAAPSDQWPIESHSADVVLGLLAIHEFRSNEERAAWFREASRCLKSGGRIILAEHVRDLANFVVYGPGFLHFHSVASWQRSWTTANLHLAETFRITPWVRVFVLTAQ